MERHCSKASLVLTQEFHNKAISLRQWFSRWQHRWRTGMGSAVVRNNAYLQRWIYDTRYAKGQYDHRSAVRVLTAEQVALNKAMKRAHKSNLHPEKVSLFDFGYGTGRVTNELAKDYVQYHAAYAQRHGGSPKNLQIVAYDVSSVGLKKAQEDLCSIGFQADGQLFWEP